MFPVEVLSAPAWFERTYPRFPLSAVHFSYTDSLNQSQLNPYSSQVIVMCTPNGPRIRIHGFIWYGHHELVYSLPSAPILPLPLAPQEYRFDYSLEQLLDGKFTPTPVTDWLFLQLDVGHEVESIPFSLLKALKAPLPPQTLPELADLEHHFPRPGPPECWFDVNLAELPNSLARRMILWPGGRVHLASDDVWQWVLLNHPLPRPLPPQLDYLVRMRHRARVETAEKMSDKQQVLERLAPCMLAIHQRPRFPRDAERQMLVRTLRPHVTLEVVGEILEEKNDSSTPTRRRWDYEGHYLKGYAPPSCEKMGEMCPMDKDACFRLFLKRFPGKLPNPKSFYGPVKWLEW